MTSTNQIGSLSVLEQLNVRLCGSVRILPPEQHVDTARLTPDSHAVYTIPVAVVLTVVLKPLLTRLDLYKICFLITVAVVYTIPW
jgi:hypothetical protein